jgi:hypothetical protein
MRYIGTDPQYQNRVELVLCQWDRKHWPISLSALQSPQLDVIQQVGDPRDCGLVICLFRHTLGGVLPLTPPLGRSPLGRPWHCTEWEINRAINAGSDADVGATSPRVWIFRDTASPDLSLTLPRNVREEAKLEFEKVEAYFAAFEDASGARTRGVNLYDDVNHLRGKLDSMLRLWIGSRSAGGADADADADADAGDDSGGGLHKPRLDQPEQLSRTRWISASMPSR